MLFGINAQPFTVHKIQPALVNNLDTLYVSPSGVTNTTTGRVVSMDLGLPPKYDASKLGDFVYGTDSRTNLNSGTLSAVISSYRAMTALQPTLIQLSETTRDNIASLAYQPSGPFIMVVLNEFWDYTLGSLVYGRLRRIVPGFPSPPVFATSVVFESASLGGNARTMEMWNNTAINDPLLAGILPRPAYVLVYKVVGDRPPTIGWLPFNLSSHGYVATDRVVFNAEGLVEMAIVNRQSNFAEVGGNVYRRLMTYLDPVTAEMTPRASELGFYLY